VARSITHNTIVVVASAPGFPHGVVDDVVGIAAAAAKRGVLCHVDACLGGYLLPFVEQLGYDVPTFDFRVPGVQSFSCQRSIQYWFSRHFVVSWHEKCRLVVEKQHGCEWISSMSAQILCGHLALQV
jgi:hypothetical protein